MKNGFKSKEIYTAFEDVVGPEYICDDPVIMPSYHWTEFAAVILPEEHRRSAGHGQAVQQAQDKFRPICTGWTGMFPKGIICWICDG